MLCWLDNSFSEGSCSVYSPGDSFAQYQLCCRAPRLRAPGFLGPDCPVLCCIAEVVVRGLLVSMVSRRFCVSVLLSWKPHNLRVPGHPHVQGILWPVLSSFAQLVALAILVGLLF